MTDDLGNYSAPPGATWVCAACGRFAEDRMQLRDVSCFMNAVLLESATLTFDGNGDAVIAGEPFAPTPA